MDVIMDVPQGSILGPVLFMIFIKELTGRCSDFSVHPHADNTVLGGMLSGSANFEEALFSDSIEGN